MKDYVRAGGKWVAAPTPLMSDELYDQVGLIFVHCLRFVLVLSYNTLCSSTAFNNSRILNNLCICFVGKLHFIHDLLQMGFSNFSFATRAQTIYL